MCAGSLASASFQRDTKQMFSYYCLHVFAPGIHQRRATETERRLFITPKRAYGTLFLRIRFNTVEEKRIFIGPEANEP